MTTLRSWMIWLDDGDHAAVVTMVALAVGLVLTISAMALQRLWRRR